MSSSRKKKTNKQLKTYLAILASVLAVLVLLALILTLGRYTSEPPVETEPSETIPPETTTEATEFTYDETFPTDPAVDSRLGIDVSEHQKNIDWGQVKAAGVEFVFIRVGSRGTTEGKLYADEMAQQYYQGAKDAGLQVGAYFYSQAVTPKEAEEEAWFVLDQIANWELDKPVAYDWEWGGQDSRTDGIDPYMLNLCCVSFCNIIENAGLQPMIYFNAYQGLEQMDLPFLQDIPFWLAMYDTPMEFPYRVDYWQYTAEGTIPGIAGIVDLNIHLISQN